MSHWPQSIARKAVRELKPYPARGAATSALHLDANESPWSPPPADGSTSEFNRYPAQQPPELLARLAALYGVSCDQIMMGRGADEAIDILVRTFCEAGKDDILICTPTFSYFNIAAQIQGAGIIDVPLNPDFTWDVDAICSAIRDRSPKLVFLCSPNNPTGNSLSLDSIAKICTISGDSLVVVDEAYIEFSPSNSAITLQPEYPNLVVTRTLSKMYALAGVRMGVCIADPRIIGLMLKVLPPYPVPRPVENAVLKALSPATIAVHNARRDTLIEERARVFEALKKSPFVTKAYPSDANFILFEAKKIDTLLVDLTAANVKIRDFRSKFTNHFRLSIGTPEENDIALALMGVGSEATPLDRTGEVFRKTNETDIAVRVNLDDPNAVQVATGIGFFDHMLEQIAKHGGLGMTLRCDGDLEIDSHHTIEDTALAFGAALKQALGNKAGIGRYGFVMPMDETQARVAVDLSGRPAFVFDGKFPTESVGKFAAEMCPHFFQSLSQALGASIQISVEGDNTHHMIEACFKGVGRALRPAFAKVGGDIPSTKGLL